MDCYYCWGVGYLFQTIGGTIVDAVCPVCGGTEEAKKQGAEENAMEPEGIMDYSQSERRVYTIGKAQLGE